MPEYADIYILSTDRNRETIEAFLDEFLPMREESADEYEVPQYSKEPKVVFKHAHELIAHCCSNPLEVHAIYWRAVGGGRPEHAMLFFLPDGHIIFGVSTDAEDDEFARMLLLRLKRYFNTCQGLLFFEQCPPETAAAFREEVRKNT